MDRGFVLTDERCRTNVEGVYAVGDIVPGLQLAHRGFQQGIFVAEEIAGLDPRADRRGRHPAGHLLRPRGRLGRLTEAQATRAVRRRRRSRRSPTTSAATARARSSRPRASSSWSAAKDGPVVGVHMVGDRVGELIGEAQLIYNWEAYPEDVAPLVHAHPTQNEALGEAHLALAGKPLHAHS